jgi:diguanylate cyclase (GGDEF)-like protein
MVEALEHFMEISRIETEPSAGSADRRSADLSIVAETGSSPATRLATESQKMRAILICGGIAFLTASFASTAAGQWPRVLAFLPTYQSIIIFAYVVTGYLIFAQYRVTRSLALLYLSGGCIYTAAILLAQFLTFPGMFLPQGALFGGSQTTIWLWCFWHIGPSMGILLYVVSEWIRPNYIVEDADRAARWSAVALMVTFGATMVAVTRLHDFLPILDANGNFGRIASTGIGPAIELLTAAGIILLWRATKFRTVLQVWLAVALFALLCDNLITMLGGDRLSIGWYVGRLNALISAVVIMFVYLAEINRAYLQSANETREIAASHADLEVMIDRALADQLTGLPSRGLFLQQAEKLRERNAIGGMATAVLFLDLDGFKAINDQFGHDYGDAVLVRVAEILRESIRDTDIAGRLGGDEFVVCLTAPALHIDATATRIAQRMVRAIAQIGDGVGCSVGIKICSIEGLEVEEAIGQADKAMYAAKRRGKNCFAFHGRPRLMAVS